MQELVSELKETSIDGETIKDILETRAIHYMLKCVTTLYETAEFACCSITCCILIGCKINLRVNQ